MKKLFWIIFIFMVYNSAAQITNNVGNCPELLRCDYPKEAIDYNDTEANCMRRICTCKGTNNAFSRSVSDLSTAKLVYTNCTLVDGNLELVGFNENVTFTKHIEQVTGYVIIHQVTGYYIDLSSLRLIRGIELHLNPSNVCYDSVGNEANASTNATEYSLFIIENQVTEIWLQNLTEISRGNVGIVLNRNLCCWATVLWEEIFYNPKKQKLINNSSNSDNNVTQCTSCVNCWGKSPNQCQLLTKRVCKGCDKRGCERMTGTNYCCSYDCAGGCFRSVNASKTTCYACREVSYKGNCRGFCPDGTMETATGDLEKDDETFKYTVYCVKNCPENVPSYERFCRTYCPDGTYDFDKKVCRKCENGQCDNICYGLGVGHGALANDTYINALNIVHFNKNCTIIEGSLHFRSSTFDGDSICDVPQLDIADLERFENVQQITGYLAVDNWPLRDLCVFKNLQQIYGKELIEGQYSLSIITGGNTLRTLCFNSLKSIQNGYVQILNNPVLCFVGDVNWDNLTNMSDATIIIDSDDSMCEPCNNNCDPASGCWGSSAEQCLKCLHYTDLTNSSGLVAPKWVTDKNEAKYPGNNVTTCVEKCDFSKGVYASSKNECLPCDVECENECNGPGPDKCLKCKHFTLNTTCVRNCSELMHYIRNQTCFVCSKNCLNQGCSGPDDAYDPLRGCHSCHYSFDVKTNTTLYRGPRCDECALKEIKIDCEDGCRMSATGDYTCYILPGPNVAIIVVPIVLLIILAFAIVMYFLRRNRSTIKEMRNTIRGKMVGEDIIDDGESMPLTPSGAQPNQAHLRIVKDSELVMGKRLGSGAFGDVHKAVWTPLNIQGEKIKIAVAVKTLKSIEELGPDANNEIMDEAYVMASVNCDYLVRLLGIRITESVSLITQLMPLGSLLQYVRDTNNQENINSRQMLTWFVQIAKGMKYLQEKHMVHRDLAARNVLVRTPNHVKITDFGLAKMLDVREDSYQAEGGKLPIKWLAIECITERLFSHHSDVWAYGITCWEILTFGSRPYEGVRAVEILSLLERGERLLQPPTATIEVYMLLVKCWMVDRSCRPSFAELLNEFSRMAMDPTRYLVLKNDNQSFSPNCIDEDKFFKQLLEEETIDDAMMADELDQYLIHRNLDDQQPVYANQEAINKTQSTHPANTGPERLFSRSTPSAVVEPLAMSSTSTNRVQELDVRANSVSDQDDVFSELGNSTKLLHRDLMVEINNGRKDSEEIHRYTEDPTNKKFIQRTTDDQYGESDQPHVGDYLIPSNSDAPGGVDSHQVSALMNDTYVESPIVYKGGDASMHSRRTSDPSYTHLASCEETNKSDYVNEEYKAVNRPADNCFVNEEYMMTGADSGIGEDTQSLLSRVTQTKKDQSCDWEQLSNDENDRILTKDNVVIFKPNNTRNKHPWSVSSDASSTSFNLSSTALNNPGYMLLNASSSNNSNKNVTKLSTSFEKDSSL